MANITIPPINVPLVGQSQINIVWYQFLQNSTAAATPNSVVQALEHAVAVLTAEVASLNARLDTIGATANTALSLAEDNGINSNLVFDVPPPQTTTLPFYEEPTQIVTSLQFYEEPSPQPSFTMSIEQPSSPEVDLILQGLVWSSLDTNG